MRVMPANATGWFWHCLARETGSVGHLYSPGAQRGPWPWLPYALDNGAIPCWDRKLNAFDPLAWEQKLPEWRRLIEWARTNTQEPLWAIVPDVPGNWEATKAQWAEYAAQMQGFTLAVAVQDGADEWSVLELDPQPSVVCVGGTDGWKREPWKSWRHSFPRVHVLRVNSPKWLAELLLEDIESCDGTGWNRGDKTQTSGLEAFLRAHGRLATQRQLWPYVCREGCVKGSGQGALI